MHEGGGRWVGSNKVVELKKKREREIKSKPGGEKTHPSFLPGIPRWESKVHGRKLKFNEG